MIGVTWNIWHMNWSENSIIIVWSERRFHRHLASAKTILVICPAHILDIDLSESFMFLARSLVIAFKEFLHHRIQLFDIKHKIPYALTINYDISLKGKNAASIFKLASTHRWILNVVCNFFLGIFAGFITTWGIFFIIVFFEA